MAVRSMADYTAMFDAYGKSKTQKNPNGFVAPGTGTAGAGVNFTPGDWMGFANAYGAAANATGLGSVAGGGGTTGTTNGGTTTGGTPGVGTVAGSGAAFPASPLSGLGYNDLFADARASKSRLDGLMNTDFKYDYSTDPSYLAAQQLARAGAKDASKHTLETMNDRGIINSSVTSSQLGQIEQQAEMEPLKLIPQLQGQAQNQRNQEMQMLYNLYSGQLNAGTNAYQFEKTFPLQESAVTGRYMSGETQSLIDTIMNAKSGWKGAKSKDEQTALAKNAADARNQLAAMGYDSEKMFGANVGLDESRKNIGSMSQLTAASQAALLNALTGTASATGNFPKNTGGMFANMPLFDGLAPVFKGIEGQPTMEREKFTAEMARLGAQAAGDRLSRVAQQQSIDYNKWLHENNISEKEALQQTNIYKSDLLALAGTRDKDGKIVDREAILRKFAKDQKWIIDKGLKVDEILTTINGLSFQPNKEMPPNSSSGSPQVVPIP